MSVFEVFVVFVACVCVCVSVVYVCICICDCGVCVCLRYTCVYVFFSSGYNTPRGQSLC